MGGREKVLVALMVVALGYGGFELLLSSSKGGGEETPRAGDPGPRDLVRRVAEDLEQAEPGSQETYLLRLAAAGWQGDPFWVRPEEPPREEPVAEEDPGPLEYTGYLEVNQRRMAIINGVEYEVGEELEQGGAVLKSITPSEVVLESTGSGRKISVPYVE